MPGRVVGGGIAAQCAGALGVRVDGTRMLGLLGRVVMVQSVHSKLDKIIFFLAQHYI